MLAIWIGFLLAAGCTAPAPRRVITDPDPSVKIPAIKHAARTENLAATGQLVKDLESDDPAIRFYAIEALFRLTGQRFGYDYYAPQASRDAAVERWQAWMREQGK